jgi:hypothetical protein
MRLITCSQGQPSGPFPGYVPSAKPHLPTPKDATFSRPQQSETFKVKKDFFNFRVAVFGLTIWIQIKSSALSLDY